MSFPRYESYKESGVEWLGDVPEHWQHASLRHACRRITDGSHFSPKSVENGKSYVTVRNLDCGKIDLLGAAKVSPEDFEQLEKAGCRPAINDVLFSKDGTVGKVAIVEDDNFVVLSSLAIISPEFGKLAPKFLFYFLQSANGEKQIESLYAGAALRRVTLDAIVGIWLPLPGLTEQQTIATFLDRETAKIDALIAEQQRLIELLKEKRQAVISHAVTKGLNPNALMKDSGIEWLGEVPEHWEVKRLRFIAQLNPSKGETTELDRETEVSFLPMEAIGDDGSINLERTRPIGEVETGYTYFREGDVTIAKITPCFENGKGAVMRGLFGGIGFGTTELIVARAKPFEATSNYLHWLFISTWFRKHGEASMYGAGGQKRVPDDFVRDFTIVFPAISEQQTIAAFLDRETAKLDTLTAEAKTAITLFQERRTALISAAVTGKIDVRGLVSLA